MRTEPADEMVGVRLTRTHLEPLIHAATLAPSPDNNQPWKFEQEPNGELLLLHDRSRALPSDVNDMFSMIALGAALENLSLAAGQHGWRTVVNYPKDFGPDPEGREVVAIIRFAEGGTPDPLAMSLEERSTNRKAYSRKPVAEENLRQLESSIADYSGLQLHWISDRSLIRKLAWIVAATDRIRFVYQPFHAELYRQLRFTPEEAETERDGLDLRCLELPPGAATMLHWLRSWHLMRRLNRIGLSRMLSMASVLQTWRTGAIGLLTSADGNSLGYLQAGRALQRVWLKATQLRLAFHPLGSVPIFFSRLRGCNGEGINQQHRVELNSLAGELGNIVPESRQRHFVLLFRLGEAASVSVRSLRRTTTSVFGSR